MPQLYLTTHVSLHGYNRASVISITLLSELCTQHKKHRVIKIR